MVASGKDTTHPSGAFVWHLSRLYVRNENGLFSAQYPPPKSLVFKALYCLRLFFASNLAGIVLHKRISTMRYVFANIHKIIVLSSSFLGFFHFVSHFLTDIMPYCMFCPTCKAADTAKVQCLPPVICTEGQKVQVE